LQLVVCCRLLGRLLRQGLDFHRHARDLHTRRFGFLTPLFADRHGFLQCGNLGFQESPTRGPSGLPLASRRQRMRRSDIS
jgi:hypothetical protein